MKPEQIQSIQHTFNQIRTRGHLAAALFYTRLFEQHPSLRPLFKTDILHQGQKLIHTLDLIVESLSSLDELIPRAHALGLTHQAHGVLPEQYNAVGDALMWMLEALLEEDFTDDVALAWKEAYALLAQLMIEASET